MSHQPFTAAALRGAVDLSSLKRPAPPAGPHPPRPTPLGTVHSVVVEGTDATHRGRRRGHRALAPGRHGAVVPAAPESADFVRPAFTSVTRRYAGRFQLVTVDVDANPTIIQAFQVQAVPVSFAFLRVAGPALRGCPARGADHRGRRPGARARAQHGVTGTVGRGRRGARQSAPPAVAEEPPLPPLHQRAYDAIEADDLDGAADAYRQALSENPADAEAKLGLAQVGLMQRTQGADLQAARAAAAVAPTDVDAQILAADLDLLGGHVEDAFLRLIDTVRVTADADRNKAREHLVELFEVIGVSDEGVVRARKSLMSALF